MMTANDLVPLRSASSALGAFHVRCVREAVVGRVRRACIALMILITGFGVPFCIGALLPCRVSCAWAGDGVSAPDSPTGVLTLTNADTVQGAWRRSPSADVIAWQGGDFTRPFEFATDTVASILFPAVQPAPNPQGEFALELVGGDILTGNFKDWTEDQLEFDSPPFGRIHIRTQAIRRIYRIDKNPMLVYAGLSGLTDWRTNGDGWQEDGRSIWTEKDDAVLTGAFSIPDKAVIEVEFSWKSKPNFVFAIGVDPSGEADDPLDGWRFETWGDVLALVREQRLRADVDQVQQLDDSVSRAHLIAYLDQSAGRVQVFQLDGTPAGEVTVPHDDKASGRKPAGGVRLINRHGHVRLERLRIAKWNGMLPAESVAGSSHFDLADGTVVRGAVVGFSQEARQLRVRGGQTERLIDVKQIVQAQFTPEPNPVSREVSVVLHDGSRILGDIEEILADRLVVRSPEVKEPLSIACPLIRSVISLDRTEVATEEDGAGRRGWLLIDGHRLAGRLVDGIEQPGASCFNWKPVGSRTSSPLRPGVRGRIAYGDLPRPASVAESSRTTLPNRRNVNVIRRTGRMAATSSRAVSSTRDVQSLHLRSGDVVSCTIQSINERGVHITTPVADALLVPHAKIKAVELSPRSMPELEPEKRDRLLTLPRAQKDSPPTHLLCSQTGDLLRCRVISMNDDTVRFELQLAEMQVPRDRVALIIWFHPDELVSDEQVPAVRSEVNPHADGRHAEEVDKTDERNSGFTGLVQALQRDGRRITFDPQQVDGDVVLGISDVLGACRVNISDVAQLIIGSEIQVASAALPFHSWKLHPAIEPKIAQDFDSSSPGAGLVSPLVGKPAPEVELQLLEGGHFSLARSRGQVVILDFWASWCSPCMQTMPLLEKAVRDFDRNKVRMISVNMEEPAEHIRSVLQRHDLNATVALDIDGVTGRRYQADAIPQTVIVDAEGNIARVYVGGGPAMVEALKEFLTELLAGESQPPEDPPPNR